VLESTRAKKSSKISSSGNVFFFGRKFWQCFGAARMGYGVTGLSSVLIFCRCWNDQLGTVFSCCPVESGFVEAVSL